MRLEKTKRHSKGHKETSQNDKRLMQDGHVTIALNVFYAKNVPKADPTGLSDPYIIVFYNSFTSKGLIKKKKRTDTKKETLSPAWNQSFVLRNVAPESAISFLCFDWDNALKFSSDDFLGKFKFRAEDIPMKQRKVWHVPLRDNMKSAGKLIFITYAVPSNEYNPEDKKQFLTTVSPLAADIDTPLYVGRYENRLICVVKKTEGLIADKDKCSVYAQVSLGKQTLETPVWKKKGDAHWDTKISMSYISANTLNIQIKDWKMIKSNTPIGSVLVSLLDIPEGQIVDKEIPIKGAKGNLHLSIHITKSENIKEHLPMDCEDEEEEDDTWSKQNTQPFEAFVDSYNPRGIINAKCKDGYHFEAGPDDLTHFLNEDVPDFNDNYFEKPVYTGIIPCINKKAYYNDVKTEKGPIIVAVGDGVGGLQKAVIVSQYGNTKTYITKMKELDSEIANMFGLKAEQVKMKECNEGIWKKLEHYELRSRLPSYKFGLIYAAPGQSAEQEFLSNASPSPLCQEFYNIIGTTINLKGYTGYRGGLDVQNDSTGTMSIVTKIHDVDIMFHVSTMLKHVETDSQHLDKKRHIGNDVCVIIFKETNGKKDDEVDLSTFLTQFNHVFIVVTPVVTKGVPMYKVCVACKSAVQGFLPRFPTEKLFKRDASFRDWLLTKLINGERASLESPQFIKSQRTALKGLLESIVEEVRN